MTLKIKTIALTAAMILFLPCLLFGHVKEGKKLSKTNGLPNWTKLNINNISTFFRNNGDSDLNNISQSGFEYPKGSGKTCFFESGFLWGARINGGAVKVGGSAYSSGLQGGKILSPGVAEDPNLGKNRIFRVRADYKTASLANDARDLGFSEQDVYDQYETDWNEWPATDGAPFDDVDSNGVYDPTVDIPGVPGANQTIWFVCNDLDQDLTINLYGSQPMGIEQQTTIWAYSQAGPLGNMLFRKYLIINKGTDTFTDMYVSMWSDPDNGEADDDFAGCDTLLSLGYVYNATAYDGTYKETPPPAAGFDFFQGPVVSSPGDTAIFKGKYLVDKKNLPMTAFYYFAKGDPSVVDPTTVSYEGTLQFYNFFQGRIGRSGEIFRTPESQGAIPTPFACSGDPVAGTGWLDGQILNAGDRRIGCSSGPFTMAPGDTQEVVVAQIAAIGTDNLNSVDLLKNYDKVAQDAYNNFFKIPGGAKTPIVNATEMDEKIILNWGDATTAGLSEAYSERGYKFQGYNVYQLPSASAAKSEGELVAVFDKIDDLKVLYDYQYDARTGKDELVPVAFGTDAGVQRTIELQQDYLNNRAMRNGTRYYFAVTTYSYNEDPLAVPKVLENPLTILTVTPHSDNPGMRYETNYGDTLKGIVHTSSGSLSDGNVVVLIHDPTKLTGHEYKVSFDTLPGKIPVWNLTDVNTGEIKLKNQTNQTGDLDYYIVDGLQVKVLGPSNDFKNFEVVANASGKLNPSEGCTAAGDDWYGFPGTAPTTAQQTNGSRWLFHTADNGGSSGGGTRYDYESFISRTTRDGSNWPSIIPYDFEMRFTQRGSWAYEAFNTGQTFQVPFELWNIGIGTPDDPSDDYRLIPWINDDGDSTYNLTGNDHSVSGGDNDPYTDWVYWYAPDNQTPGEAGYLLSEQEMIAKTYDGSRENVEIMARTVLVNWNGGVIPGPYNADLPETGTIFRITSTKPNSLSDVYKFTAPTNTYNSSLAKNDVQKVNVFPNPYYGVNPEEINKYQRFVTFNHLPKISTIRIFNIAGEMVRVIRKDSETQFQRWDLANENGLPVGSGLYIAYIDMGELGTKILKLSVIQEQQILDRF
jgi:hypothetical protein